VRRAGNGGRARVACAVALAGLAGLAGATLAACSSGATSSPNVDRGSTAPARSTPTTPTPAPGARPAIVAVTTGGTLEVLDPDTGTTLHTLATGAAGDEVATSPGGSTVYFEAAAGCRQQIESVPSAGGSTTAIADGTDPALSSDGTELAYARQPDLTTAGCQSGVSNPASDLAVVVRQLSTGRETTYPMSPQAVATGLPAPILHLSWAPDGHRLAVSVAEAEDNEGWQVTMLDTTSSDYYVGSDVAAVPVTGAQASVSYYREAVFQPDGNLFVNRVCCSGIPPRTTSSLLLTVDPTSGRTVRQIAVGYTTVTHSSLDVDRSGHWLLYLSGDDLLVSHNGARPTPLATGLSAAAW
jgi:hypothetical protein